MKQYLVWNIKQQAWRMSELIGFTDDVEFAETFSEMYLRQNTGMFDSRTGDYAFNLLVNSNTLEIEDFKTRMAKLSTQDKKAFKKAIMVERKRRGMPIEIVIKDNKKELAVGAGVMAGLIVLGCLKMRHSSNNSETVVIIINNQGAC